MLRRMNCMLGLSVIIVRGTQAIVSETACRIDERGSSQYAASLFDVIFSRSEEGEMQLNRTREGVHQ
jgi:hypothetical protein